MQKESQAKAKTKHHKPTLVMFSVTGVFLLLFFGLALAHELRPLVVVNELPGEGSLAINGESGTSTTDTTRPVVPQ